MIAIDQRTGNRVWQKDIGSDKTPWIAGNTIYVVSTDNDLVALNRDTGGIRWVTPLQRVKDDKDPTSDPVYWTGPVLAGNRVIVVSNRGRVMEVNPASGRPVRDWQSGYTVSLPLAVAGQTLYMLTDDGTLLAYK
jgi:outer membrane protein assembly factor BamB